MQEIPSWTTNSSWSRLVADSPLLLLCQLGHWTLDCRAQVQHPRICQSSSRSACRSIALRFRPCLLATTRQDSFHRISHNNCFNPCTSIPNLTYSLLSLCGFFTYDTILSQSESHNCCINCMLSHCSFWRFLRLPLQSTIFTQSLSAHLNSGQHPMSFSLQHSGADWSVCQPPPASCVTPSFIEFSEIEVKDHIHKYTVTTIAVSHEIASLRNVTLRYCALELGPELDSFATCGLSAQCANRCDPMWWQM